jgi:hypothetical protein
MTSLSLLLIGIAHLSHGMRGQPTVALYSYTNEVMFAERKPQWLVTFARDGKLRALASRLAPFAVPNIRRNSPSEQY